MGEMKINGLGSRSQLMLKSEVWIPCRAAMHAQGTIVAKRWEKAGRSWGGGCIKKLVGARKLKGRGVKAGEGKVGRGRRGSWRGPGGSCGSWGGGRLSAFLV